MKNRKACKSSTGLFSILNVKFKPQHAETVKSLQYCKLSREDNKSVEGWMDCVGIKANELNCKECAMK